jgi:hypothetical protein
MHIKEQYCNDAVYQNSFRYQDSEFGQGMHADIRLRLGEKNDENKSVYTPCKTPVAFN